MPVPRIIEPRGLGRAGVLAASSSTFPLSVHSSGKYLQTASGAPFLLIGDTAWELAINLTLAEVDTYVADRKARGYNALILEVPEHDFCVNPAPQNVNGDTPFTTPGDFSTQRAAYWNHVDAVFAKLTDFQLFVWPAYLGYGGGTEGWYADMATSGTTKMQNYASWLASRYAGYQNITWVLGGDYTPPDTSTTNAVFAGLKASDPAGRLYTAHWDGSGADHYATDVTLAAGSFSLQTVYDWTLEVSASVLAAGATKPVIGIETHYDNYTGIANQVVRGCAWAMYLQAPRPAGHFAGDENVWPFGASGFGTSTDWAANLGNSNALNMTTVSTALKSRSFWLLSPDTSHLWITAGYGTAGSAGYVPVSAADDSSFFVAYVPDARNAVTLAKSRFPSAFSLNWIDPLTGAAIAIGTAITNTGSQSYSRATANSGGDHDFLLIGEV